MAATSTSTAAGGADSRGEMTSWHKCLAYLYLGRWQCCVASPFFYHCLVYPCEDSNIIYISRSDFE